MFNIGYSTMCSTRYIIRSSITFNNRDNTRLSPSVGTMVSSRLIVDTRISTRCRH